MTGSETITPEELARLREGFDRDDILGCQLRFTRALDRFERELFLSAFHPDAVISAGVFVGGPDKLYDWARDLHDRGQLGTLHYVLNHYCEIDGEVAHAETYYIFHGRNRDETNWIAGGRYLDRLERRERSWKVAERFTLIEWSGMIPTMAIPYADVPDLHVNGAPSRNRQDPSYQRPLINRRELNIPGWRAARDE